MRPRSAIGRPGPLSAGLGRVPASRRRHRESPTGIIIVIAPENGRREIILADDCPGNVESGWGVKRSNARGGGGGGGRLKRNRDE